MSWNLRRLLAYAIAFCLLLGATLSARAAPQRAAAISCVLANGGFEESSFEPWRLQVDFGQGASASLDSESGRESARSAKISVDAVGTNPWDIQLTQSKVRLARGRINQLVLYGRASSDRPVELLLQRPAPGYAVVWSATAFLTADWQRFAFDIPGDDGDLTLFINSGQATGQIWFDDVSLCSDAEPEPTTTPAPQPTRPPSTACRIVNGSFETNTISPWRFEVSGLAEGVIAGDFGARGPQAARITVSRAGASAQDVRLAQTDLNVSSERWVFLDFYARDEDGAIIQVVLTGSGRQIWSNTVRVPGRANGKYTQFFFPIRVPAMSDGELSFGVGGAAQSVSLDAIQLCDAPPKFSDEFVGDAWDPNTWQFCKAFLEDCATEDANGSIEWWKPGNATVSDGSLKMAFTRETNTLCVDCTTRNPRNVTRDFAGVLMQTSKSFKTRTGYIEARMKLPAARGLWPAFWLMPMLSDRGDIVWPPEIDVVEQFTNDPNETFHTLHYPTPGRNLNDGFTIKHPFVVADDFHVFAVNWTDQEMIWYVDGVEVHRTGVYPVRNEMYMTLSVGSGGPAGQPDNDLSRAVTEVDYVRVYANNFAFGDAGEPEPLPTIDPAQLTQRIFLPITRRNP